jgi:hypothetical protein
MAQNENDLRSKIVVPEELKRDTSLPETISVDNPQTELEWFFAEAIKRQKSGMIGNRNPETGRLEVDEP